MQSDPGSDPIKIAEIFRALSDGIFTELAVAARRRPVAVRDLDHPPQPSARVHQAAQHHGPRPQERSLLRRLPLRHLLRRLVVVPARRQEPGEAAPRRDRPEDRQAPRAARTCKIDDTTLAHLKEIRFRIDKVLKANLNANEP